MDPILIVLRIVHVVGGVFWAGAILFVVHFLEPAVRDTGPDGARVMQALQRRRYLEVVPVTAFLTLVSGYVLYWRTFSLWIVTGAHFGWNATLSLLADLPVSGLEMPAHGIRASLSGPEILTGGAYGPEGGLALLVVLVPAIGWAVGTRHLRREESAAAPYPLPGK